MTLFEFATSHGWVFDDVWTTVGTGYVAHRGSDSLPACRSQRDAIVAVAEEEWRRSGTELFPRPWLLSQGVECC